MQKSYSFLLLLSLCIVIYTSTGCKKKSGNPNNTNTATTFADSLRKSCTLPFAGPGDSSGFYLATAFTPNGDGINDLYRIVGKSLNFTSFLMTVYDTTGTLVFRSNNAAHAWDGTDTATGRQSTKYKFYVEVAYTTSGNKSANAGTFVFLLSTNAASGCINTLIADSSRYEFGDQFSYSGFNAGMPSYENFCH